MEYQGIHVGTVTEVPFVVDGISAVGEMEVPVLISLELERIEQLSATTETVITSKQSS